MNRKKQILFSFLCIGLLVCLNACEKGNKWVFSLNGEKLYDKDITVFGLIYAKEYNIENTDKLKKTYEGNETYEEYYKSQLEDEIISTVLLYGRAKENNCKLTKEEEKEISQNAEELINAYGKEWIETKDITHSDIEKIYKMKFLGNSYIDSLTEEEDEDAQKENTRYIKVYQVTFPTVLLDENGMIQSAQDGTVQKQSEAEIAEKQSEAETFAEKARSGEDMKELVKDYDDTVTGVEKTLKYEDLDSEYKKAVDKISEGESSDVISSEYGYYVIKLMDADDIEYEESISGYEAAKASQDKQDEVLKELYDTYIGDDKDYKNSKRWDEIEIISFLQ